MTITHTPPLLTDRTILHAYVVFCGRTDLPWLRVLKAGFRHCFVILNDGRHWVTIDPLASHMDVQVLHLPPAFDLPDWLSGRGHTVIEAPITTPHTPAPLLPFAWVMPFTCVESVKRVLGLRGRGLITPWQLYRYLTRVSPAASPKLKPTPTSTPIRKPKPRKGVYHYG